jgi:hypothetical protein
MPRLTRNQESTLVQILAQTDALFYPHRMQDHNLRAACAIHERRCAFARRGVDLVIGGDAPRRLVGWRELQALQSAGFIKQHRLAKRIGVSLTEKGDDIARALSAGVLARQVVMLLEHIEFIKEVFQGRGNCGFILETHLIKWGADYGDPGMMNSDLDQRANFLLPLLARGWIQSFGDMLGRIGYRTTELGRAQTGRKWPRTRLPRADQILVDEYENLFDDVLAERESWKPSSPTHLLIPLGAGSWPKRPELPDEEEAPT